MGGGDSQHEVAILIYHTYWTCTNEVPTKPHQKESRVLIRWNNTTILGSEKHEFEIPKVIFGEFDAKVSGRNVVGLTEWQQFLTIIW